MIFIVIGRFIYSTLLKLFLGAFNLCDAWKIIDVRAYSDLSIYQSKCTCPLGFIQYALYFKRLTQCKRVWQVHALISNKKHSWYTFKFFSYCIFFHRLLMILPIADVSYHKMPCYMPWSLFLLRLRVFRFWWNITLKDFRGRWFRIRTKN